MTDTPVASSVGAHVRAPLAELRRRLRRFDRELEREFRRALGDIARSERKAIQDEARSQGGVAAKSARSVGLVNQSKRVGVKLRNRGGYEFGAEFGSHQYRQFRAYNEEGYWFFSTIRRRRDRINREVLEFLTDFARRI